MIRALMKRNTLRVRDKACTPRGSGVAKNMMEFMSAKLVRKAYASSVKPLPRVYSPGTLTNTETNRTIHQAIVTNVRNMPGISGGFARVEITYIS